ncbi:hypothetical protein N8I77_010097 [Diaporthe amygdali]|uniref:DNA/RNA-binding domain-containing protein n=1 Tax=Phomopsis amygdali TaxID=1214568 RepID=A0AAD9S6F7_PHOAM|nr:hypothetical protein N8I77_010097 [Diaporthe amygdali]
MANLAQGWINHLRRQAKNDQAAPASTKEPPPPSPSKDEPSQEPGNDKIDDTAPREPSAPAVSGEPTQEDVTPARKRLKSPTNSVKAGDRTRSPSPNRRSKGRHNTPADESTADFPTRPSARTKGRLWNEGDPILTRNPAAQPSPQQQSRPSRRRENKVNSQTVEEEDPSVNTMLPQPETRPISQEQLVAEVKGIYAGLVMVESKCIEVDSSQSAQNDSSPKLNNEQWQALIALHRTLLHEHHDFFLASQHPSASPALRRLASKYAMPARMWRHGIHSFLELLRHRLPASLEHMLTFIYLAYSMMALLYETVPNFEDTWIECLGDLGRYRMAIEDEDIRDREIWTDVSRYWYSKASDKAPTTGRLHHHLAILARPNAVKQLFYYTKSLCVAIPFKSARDSILTLFDPIINGTQTRLQAIDLNFVKAHGILFITSNTDEKDKAFPKNRDELMVEYEKAKSEFLSHLDNHIARTTRSWMEPGALIAISNCNSQLEYGKTEANTHGNPNVLMTAILPESDRDTFMENSTDDRPVPSKVFSEASDLAKQCDAIISRRYGDPNVLPYLNVRLSFMKFMSGNGTAIGHLQDWFPWTLVALMLNSLSIQCQNHERIEFEEFPQPNDRPLPEDWSLRGLLWTDKLFPSDWFHNKVDDDEKTFELPSMTEHRKERVLWLGCRLAVSGKWLTYDKQTKHFSVTPEFQKDYPEYAPSEDATLTGKEGSMSRSSTFGSSTTEGSEVSVTEQGDCDTANADDDASMVMEKIDS